MKIYKQKPDKRKTSFFIFTGIIALILVLSFSSITNVHANDGEVVLIDEEVPLAIDENQGNSDSEVNSDIGEESEENDSNESEDSESSNDTNNSKESLDDSDDENNDNSANNQENNFTDWEQELNNLQFANVTDRKVSKPKKNKVSNITKGNSEQKDVKSIDLKIIKLMVLNSLSKHNDSNSEKHYKDIDVKPIDLDIINYNDFYSFINQYDPNSQEFFNDINEQINKDILLPISSLNFKGNGENFIQIIKKVANINFNKNDVDEEISIIQDNQSISFQTLTIPFYIKIFMDYHNHGKEHLNSF